MVSKQLHKTYDTLVVADQSSLVAAQLQALVLVEHRQAGAEVQVAPAFLAHPVEV